MKLADFGIARLFGDSRQTQAGTVVGTAEYMAPEQAAGEPVDQRVDLYALGLVMYAMLVGRPPFRGPDLADVLRRQQRETPPRVSSFVPEVPPSLDTLIEKLLSKKPGDRPGSALAVGRLLTAIGADSHATPLTEQNAPGVTFTTHGVHSTRPFNRENCEGDTGVDLLAATVGAGSNAVPIGETKDSGNLQERSAVDRAPPTPSTAGADQSLVHRRTESFERSPGDDRPTGNRFTTIEDLQRQAQNDAERAARREAVFSGGLAAILFAGVLAGGYALLRPATADQLHARILAVADDPAADLRDAQPLIDLFLARFPEDPRADAIRSLDRSLAIDALERRARRRPRSDATLSPLERDYRAAMAREEDSPLACLAALEAILAIHDPAPEPTPTASLDAADAPDLWLALVRRQIERVDPIAARERAEDLARVSATLAEAANLAETATTSPPAERQDLLARREALLEGLIEIYGSRPHAAEAVAEAQQVL